MGTFLKVIKSSKPYNFMKFIFGLGQYALTGQTPAFGHRSMISLFESTGGALLDRVSTLISLIRPKIKFPAPDGVLGRLSRADIQKITDDLRENGYHLSSARLPQEICERLLQLALTESVLIDVGHNGRAAGEIKREKFNREFPQGIRATIDNQFVINHPLIQELMFDSSILTIVQEYLGSAPVLDMPSFWWNAPSLEPSKDAAQWFHYDLDRIRWIKIFFYITDVAEENGPHAFVKGTHRTNSIPKALLQTGYSRLSDRDVEAHFSKEKIIYMLGKSGTILLEDTRGLHKGRKVQKGDRLVLQFQYSNSLFGSNLGRLQMNEIHSSLGQSLWKQNRRLFKLFKSR
jgi:hypothetical protein